MYKENNGSVVPSGQVELGEPYAWATHSSFNLTESFSLSITFSLPY